MISDVYLTREQKNIPLLLERMEKYLVGNNLAIKTHFGEKNNTTFLPADICKEVYIFLKNKRNVNLIESNVLYKGERTFSKSHIKLAREHGFNFSEIDIYDEKNADDCWKLNIGKKYFSEIKVVKNLKKYDSLVVLSHFKGHVSAGFGGALKNVGMGLASRAGKLDMHSNMAPTINPEKCTGCGICMDNCPVNAISLEKNLANIDNDKCIGCASCIAICQNHAPGAWDSTPQELQERIVEYAYGILKNIKAVYINCLLNITPHCDCYGESDKIIIKHIGFLASNDPVAIDQASYDLVLKEKPDIDKFIPFYSQPYQLEYAKKLKLGSKQYRLINLL